MTANAGAVELSSKKPHSSSFASMTSTSSSQLAATREFFYMKSFAMDLEVAKELSVSGSISAIFTRTRSIVKACLGPGKSLSYLLWLMVIFDAIPYLIITQAISVLILSTLSSSQSTGTPKEMAAGLLILSMGLVFLQLVRHFILDHAGTWFMRRAKYAINKCVSSLTTDDEGKIMQHLAQVRDIFVYDWTKMTAVFLVEISSVLTIAFYNMELMCLGAVLICGGKFLGFLDDLFVISEQHRLAQIVNREGKSDSGTEADIRFLHNQSSGARHVIVKMTHTLFCYFSPVAFLFFAMSSGAKATDEEGSLTTTQVFQSSILFFLSASCQIAQHGRMTHFIKNLSHCEKILEFNDTNGNCFDYFKNNPSDSIPFSKKKDSTMFTWTHAEKAGIFLTTLLFVAIVGFFVFLTQNVEFACNNVKIMCTTVPDSGSHVSFMSPQEFNLLVGCKLSDEEDVILAQCAQLMEAGSEEESEEIDFDIMEEEYVGTSVNDTYSADVGGELDASSTLQMEASANPQNQADESGQSGFIIAASFDSWRGTHRFEREFVEVEAEETEESSGRRLTSSTYAGVGSTFSATRVTSKKKSKEYTIELIAGGGRYDGTNNEISIQIVGTDSKTTSHMNVGNKFGKGEVRNVVVADTTAVANIKKIVVTTSGKDGVKFTSILVNRHAGSNTKGFALGSMSASLKCTGSKRKGTWSCSQDVTVEKFGDDSGEEENESDNSGCPVEECKYDMDTFSPIPASEISDYTTPVSDVTQLDYEFGTVWNDCTANGPVRFTYEAVCDGGCQKRAHSFRLSPKSYFPGEVSSCQQKNGKSYPKYCLDPLKDGQPWSLAGLNSKKRKEQCSKQVGHDRGHQIPANNFDHNKKVCAKTNYMTNIMPQADKMNRGAWLKTEMLGECWRQENPLTILGGGVFIQDVTTTVPEWDGVDRTDWFVDTHYVKNPAYFWKIIVAEQTDKQPYDVIAFWVPNHESATNKKIDDYVVSVSELEDKLALWGAPETFTLKNGFDKTIRPWTWIDPKGCSRQ
ncbi:hypothetical protein TL16_g02750 [Triparma laevis f. inornata]|uniref:DNA/RNA non-specific endonuclease domain-containing protein n=1 Tax=Triparma laevis f. inornata TaxID=1714386 RepID=A0A9W6ZXY1_9STRA|nr:hypothetical protein TL16_g02750 [Triparma laevis f. inornata]